MFEGDRRGGVLPFSRMTVDHASLARRRRYCVFSRMASYPTILKPASLCSLTLVSIVWTKECGYGEFCHEISLVVSGRCVLFPEKSFIVGVFSFWAGQKLLLRMWQL